MNRPFEPNIIRFRKFRRRFPKGIIRDSKLVLYNCGIMAIESGMLKSKHLETIRINIVTYFKRQMKPFMRTMANVSYTSKPFDIRRGRGKGSVEGWYFYAREGKILVEFNSNSLEQAKDLARIIRSKLPIKTKLITSISESSTEKEINTNEC